MKPSLKKQNEQKPKLNTCKDPGIVPNKITIRFYAGKYCEMNACRAFIYLYA